MHVVRHNDPHIKAHMGTMRRYCLPLRGNYSTPVRQGDHTLLHRSEQMLLLVRANGDEIGTWLGIVVAL